MLRKILANVGLATYATAALATMVTLGAAAGNSVREPVALAASYVATATPSTYVRDYAEDDAEFDCRFDGNRVCGPVGDSF